MCVGNSGTKSWMSPLYHPSVIQAGWIYVVILAVKIQNNSHLITILIFYLALSI